MALKKQHFAEDEIAIFDEACIYRLDGYWQSRLWLPKKDKYLTKRPYTLCEATTMEKGQVAYLEIYAEPQQGKNYSSISTREIVR